MWWFFGIIMGCIEWLFLFWVCLWWICLLICRRLLLFSIGFKGRRGLFLGGLYLFLMVWIFLWYILDWVFLMMSFFIDLYKVGFLGIVEVLVFLINVFNVMRVFIRFFYVEKWEKCFVFNIKFMIVFIVIIFFFNFWLFLVLMRG